MEDPSIIKNAVGGEQAPMQFPPMNANNPQQASELGQIDQDQNNTMTNIDRRLRVLEERFSNLHRRSQVSEQNALKSNKDVQKEIRTGMSDIKSLRLEINDIKEKFRILVNELRGYATKEEFKVLEKYVNMWEPVTFVSRNEVDKLIEDAVEQRFADLNIRMQQEKFVEQEVAKTFARMKSQGQLK